MLNTPIGRLRAIGMIEGISFLLLLFVAMPLKYLAGQPLAVRIVGMAHGILFLVFCLALFQAMVEHRWSLRKAAGPFIASLIPFGPFIIDKKLKTEDETSTLTE